jgi:hypothetical protein
VFSLCHHLKLTDFDLLEAMLERDYNIPCGFCEQCHIVYDQLNTFPVFMKPITFELRPDNQKCLSLASSQNVHMVL